ncbi:MAG: flagellar basal body M-ring protein FliF [Gammaproteobacteria bacterium]|nr:flagellar basal body M-ring protein FliF [Gammaproteobacteria bacterium]
MSAGLAGLGGLSALRQIGIMIGLAASLAIGVTVGLWSWAPSYGVLYGALEEQDVGAVMDALRTSGIKVKLDDTTGAVLVPAKDIYEARIKLASMNLPKGVSAGFDALDEKNGFGVSQFMERARFHRALEVELGRTVSSLNNVKHARVHLAMPRQSVFVRNRKKASASVTVNLFPGRSLEPGQVAAIVHMVSSSVPNLGMAQVTVVDQTGKLLTNGQTDRQMAMSGAQFEYTQRVERSLTERIERILEPMLGAQAVRAQVTADIDFTISEQTQESFNPDTSALRSNQLTLEQSSGGGAEGGVPGALSNQPPGLARAPETLPGAAPEAGTPMGRTNRREIKNFELDKTISHTRFAPGRLHRLSVAVLVDDKVTVDDSGVVTRRQRTPEELDRLTGLVREAVGFNAQRGDSVNVMNSAFTVPAAEEPLPEPPIWEQAWVQDLVKKLLGGILVLVIFFGVLKPVLKSLASQPAALAAIQAKREEEEVAMAEDKLTLESGGEVPAIGGPGSYEQNMLTASKAVEQDPKLVAQVVKNWVASDGG